MISFEDMEIIIIKSREKLLTYVNGFFFVNNPCIHSLIFFRITAFLLRYLI